MIDKLIQLLTRLRQSKEMFLYPLTSGSLENYLNGFRGAGAACGVEAPRKLRQQVIEARGWKFSAAGPAPQMKQKGLTDEAIMDELIDIEIALLQHIAKAK